MRYYPALIKFVINNTITIIVRPFSIIFFVSVFSYISCTDNGSTWKRHVNPAEIFFDYQIRGEENDSMVSAYLLYKMGGPNGIAIKLTDPAKVELDSEAISFDSAKLARAFYDIEIPADNFTGEHTIVFTDFDNRQFKEEFIYKPFRLKTKIPPAISRRDLTFDFIGLADEDYLRVILTDTSFMSRDIHEIDTVKNNRLVISADKLKNLTDGPITLQFYKETERPVRNGTRAGGRIVVSYGMLREFVLKDSVAVK